MCAVDSHVWVLCSPVVCAAIVHAAAAAALVLPLLEGVASDNLQVTELVWYALVGCAASQSCFAELSLCRDTDGQETLSNTQAEPCLIFPNPHGFCMLLSCERVVQAI